MSRTKSPRILSSVVQDVCRTLGMNKAIDDFRTVQIWKEVVGTTIAEITLVERYTDGKLFVRVKSAPWRMELNYRKTEIKNKLNVAIGKEIIEEIIFR
ncbi:DUF721 domain-containing protein [Chlorobium phaeobacteroides]|jgi:predicted nucleic acid-binding Zn ribbon protein|uniref:DUF721 domain-containing protein n=1 Tax=Chlorobium phaeobacteroides (strain DSM 266 / SMG 266 / 2430) TaxID=290317 RepID=A1BCH4_CHLPD|nr:DUF721 domain-containing protein [Chlorobium phaeobacteroides]ABL64081.1 conserved hypothetical protein [Chlorobium phaeobacteroides DSM 266]MBV5319865.1 DUF721 domain-containing protein [Chlorobium phaeobacteroides]